MSSKAPEFPWTGREPPPKTRGEQSRRFYVEAMHANSWYRFELERGRAVAAEEWFSIFEQYRDLCTEYEKIDPDMPLTEVKVPTPCKTSGCDGLHWVTTLAQWHARKRGEPQPTGVCPRCWETAPP